MSLYSISLFLHIVAVLALFSVIGVEMAGFVQLRRAATTAGVREWMAVLSTLGRIARPAAITIVATGIYLAVTRWGNHAWISLGLLGLVLIAVIGGGVTGRRVQAIGKGLPAGDGPISETLAGRLHDPVLRTSVWVRVALLLGIVFDMSVKPGTVGALAAIGVALALGVVVGVAGRGGERRSVPAGRYEAQL